MGFHIPGDRKTTWGDDNVTDFRKHLNLSEFAKNILKEDERIFSNGAKENRTGFLNTVFTNFYEASQASISRRCSEEREKLEAMFSSPEFKSMDKRSIEAYTAKMLEMHKNKLIAKAKGYEKGRCDNYKLRVNAENTKILRNSEESTYYPDSDISTYLKAIFEEYAEKPMYEREQIYFKKTIDAINSAIAQKKRIKMAILEKINPNNKRKYTRRFYFWPYKIVQDKYRMFNYVVGYAEEVREEKSDDPDNPMKLTKTERKVTSYRISRIVSPCVTSQSGFLSKAEQEAIDTMMMENDVQFLTGKIEDIKVRFTDKGLESFNRQIYMRPHDYVEVPGEENTFIFKCSHVQALFYFLKFGRDVEILEPRRLRESFVLRYRSAYKVYCEDETPNA